MATRWFWIRHARRDESYPDQKNPPACVKNITPILLKEYFSKKTVWISSPMQRAQDTALALGAKSPLLEPAFSEQSFGEWEPVSWDKIEQDDPVSYARYWKDPVGEIPPAGESFHQLYTRVAQGIETHNADYTGQDIVVTSHAGPIRAALALALGGPGFLPQSLSLEIPCLSLIRMDYLGGKQWIIHLGIPLLPNSAFE